MSYTYLQELEEESLVESFSDIPAYVLSRLNLTAGESCCNDSVTESCRDSQSGMMCEPSMANPGAEMLTSCVEDSRARTSALQEKGQASKESEVDSGPRWPAWFAKWSPASSSWKTPQCSLLAGLDVFSGIWPKWGMMRDGVCLEQSMLVPHTEGSEYGLWPTPRAQMKRPVRIRNGFPKGHNSNLEEVVATLSAGFVGTVTIQKGDIAGGVNDGCMEMFPTPTARDWRSRKASQATMEKNARPLSEMIGGSLNPTWVEWLMGWPLGWTDLKPLAMDKFRQWLRSHGKH